MTHPWMNICNVQINACTYATGKYSVINHAFSLTELYACTYNLADIFALDRLESKHKRWNKSKRNNPTPTIFRSAFLPLVFHLRYTLILWGSGHFGESLRLDLVSHVLEAPHTARACRWRHGARCLSSRVYRSARAALRHGTWSFSATSAQNSVMVYVFHTPHTCYDVAFPSALNTFKLSTVK